MNMVFRYRRWIRWCLGLAVLFCLILPSLRRTNLASNDSTEVTDKRLHYIVRHWHADGTHEDKDGYLKEGDPAVTVPVRQKAGEIFSGFATAAGHDAVERKQNEDKPEESSLRISYEKDIHLVKVHAFYKSRLEKEGANDLGAKETQEKTDGTKVYNTSKDGLHTDKTAKAVRGDGRDFELTLESWFVGNNQADVGMVLDASGSMAFTSNNLEPIRMSDQQIKQYGREKYISQDQVNHILNPFYTDNSKLAYSGYSYFVYDPSDETKEFVPIGYWNGVTKTISPGKADLPEKDSLQGYYSFDSTLDRRNEAEVLTGDRELDEVRGDTEKEVGCATEPDQNGIVDAKGRKPTITSDTGTGFNDTGKSLDLAATYRAESGGSMKKDAARLDLHPENATFTISFAVKGTDTKPVVWIGGNSSDKKAIAKEWYAIYADTERGKIKVSSGSDTTGDNDIDHGKEGTKAVEATFTPTGDWTVCTCTFKQDSGDVKVTIYVDGDRKRGGTLDDIFASGETKNPYILLGGSAWAHDYGGDGWAKNEESRFLLDELYFYGCALSDTGVEKLYQEMPQISTKTLYAATTPSSGGEKTMARLQDADCSGDGEGWYLVSSDSEWNDITNKELLTAKRYNGIPGDEVIYNRIEEVPKGTKDPGKGNTDRYIYTKNKENFQDSEGVPAAIEKASGWNGSIIFFIDQEGYLRCFFNTGKTQDRKDDGKDGLNTDPDTWEKNGSYCSYVYKKEDQMRIKTEALQYALGSFVTRLSEVSPDSRVSAVRFSTESIKNADTLVLQNWTTNTMESTDMLGLRRGEQQGEGERTITSYDESNGMKQYNYALTGGTVTKTGLSAYLKKLDEGKTDAGDKVNKSLIIFTDGKDTSKDEQGAVELADQLKKKGYQIYCVMLQSAGNELETSYPFLTALASGEDYVFAAEDIDSLTEVFTEGILDQIVNNLPGYTIQDYIDPRFDLVDAEGKVISLGAGGSITAGGKKRQLSSQTGYQLNTTKKRETDAVGTVGENALLFYDSAKDMYYLQWRSQTIPGCGTGSERLDVWKTRVRVRAKEDFIGGNAVISNGNADGMNKVYDPDNENPSKGFPRTAVNVAPLKLKLENVRRRIYMGQTIVPEDALSDVGSRVKEQVYYEYLERYTNWLSQQKKEKDQDLPGQLKSGKEIRIPYYYLPDGKGKNQAGKVQPEEQIGWLTYKWTQCDKNGVPKTKGTYTRFETKDTESRYYQLAVSYQPMSVRERAKETGRIISDKNDSSPKTAVGTVQTAEVRGLGMHQTDIVRGELVVEARVRLADLEYLVQKNNGKWSRSESFPVTRTYNDKEETLKLEISFSYTTEKLKALKADKDGYVSVFSKPSRSLPIGRYTVKPENKKEFPFTSIKAKKIVNGNGHFSKSYTKAKKEANYAAPSSKGEKNTAVSFYMGVAKKEKSSAVDLDAQLGHAVVTYGDITATTRLGDKLPTGRTDADREPGIAPGTGDEAKPIHVLILMLASMGVIIMVVRRKRYLPAERGE